MRLDSDLMGTMEIADDCYYGIQTTRALELGDISYCKLTKYPAVIHAMAKVKKACAQANVQIGAMKADVGEAICQACDELIQGQFLDQFSVDMYAGGGAIAINMSINEVIANRANEILTGHKGYDRVHPNTHVNMCQSTNDVVPSAMKLVVYEAVHAMLTQAKAFEEVLEAKVVEFGDNVKLARTCLNDALPITFGQQFSGYLSGIRRQRQRIEHAMQTWLSMTLGGTAVGTSVGTMPGFIPAVYEALQQNVNPKIQYEENVFDGMQNADGYLYLSGLVKCYAVILSKFCYDLKMMGSGPFAGFGEIVLPTVQAGSSIMPSKVNPVLPEMMIQVAQQVCGNDTTITMAVEKGELDLNIGEQILLKATLDSLTLLTRALPIFGEKCVKGIKINAEKTRSDAERTTALVTMFSVIHGYKPALAVAMTALEKGIPVKEAAIQTRQLTIEQVEELFDPLMMTSPEKMYALLEKYKDIRTV